MSASCKSSVPDHASLAENVYSGGETFWHGESLGGSSFEEQIMAEFYHMFRRGGEYEVDVDSRREETRIMRLYEYCNLITSTSPV